MARLKYIVGLTKNHQFSKRDGYDEYVVLKRYIYLFIGLGLKEN